MHHSSHGCGTDLLQKPQPTFTYDLSIGPLIKIHRLDGDFLSHGWDAEEAPFDVPLMVKRAAALPPR